MPVSLIKDLTRPWDMSSESVRRNFTELESSHNRLESRVGTLPTPVALTYAAIVAIDVSVTSHFVLVAIGSPTMTVPVGAYNGKRILIQFVAAGGANRTLSLVSQVGGFRFGSTITGLTATVAGKTDYIECVFNGTAGYWDVLDVKKGY